MTKKRIRIKGDQDRSNSQEHDVRVQFRRARSSSADSPTDDFLSVPYQLIWNGGRPCSTKWSSADKAKFQQHLADFASGTVEEEAVEWIGPILHQFLLAGGCIPPEQRRSLDKKECGIQLTADTKSTVILTNIPWEMTYFPAQIIDGDESLFKTTLGCYPVARIVGGRNPSTIPDGKIRALYCISNPPHSHLARFDADKFAHALEAVFRGFPIIDKRDMTSNHEPTWERIEEIIESVEPHLFILVGHGRSGSGTPELLFGEDWIPVSQLAKKLAATKRNVLAVLVCCDFVRVAETPGAQSGALTLVREGIPGVVAMQGMIEPSVAEVFLKTFLNYLLMRPSLEVAAAAGRRDASLKSLQGFLPTVFLNGKGTSGFFYDVLSRYQEKLRPLLHDFPDPGQDFERTVLETTLDKELDKSGVVVVRGGLGTGKTHLIRRVARRRLGGLAVPSRPLFYIACDRLPEGGAMRRSVFRELADKLNSNAALLPESGPPAVEDAASIVDGIDRRRIVVVLDGFYGGRNKAERESWNELLERACEMKKSLIVVVPRPRVSVDLPSASELSVPFFRMEETRDYLKRFVPKLAINYKKIHRWAGGTPLFLDSLRRFQGQLGARAIHGKSLRSRQPRQIADLYIKRVAGLLSKNELQTLCNLCRLPGPASVVWCTRLLDETKNKDAVEYLREIGMVDSSGDESHPLCHVPTAKAQAVRRAYPARCRTAGKLITQRFQVWLAGQKDPWDEAIAKLARQPGGPAILQGMQAAYLEMRQEEQAKMLATMANVPGVSDDELWGLYAPVIALSKRNLKVFSDAGLAHNGESRKATLRLLVRAAELAQNVGRQEDACNLLRDLSSTTQGYDRVVILKTRPAFLKDTKQHKALEEIQKSYDEAVEIAREGMTGSLDDGSTTREEWKYLFLEVVQERLNTRIFLAHASPAELAQDINELEKSGGESRHLGLALCKLAERELRQDNSAVKWDLVAENLVRAKKILEGTADDLVLSYCLYQYGQYLRRKPNPETAAAIAIYEKAETLGSRGGDPRREGLPFRQRVRLMWQQGSLSASLEDVSLQIDDLLRRLERQSGDSLTLRVLERLYSLRAEIGRERPGDPTARYLQRACRVSADPLLTAKTDVEHCGRAFRRYLKFLKDTKRFDEAQEFLVEFGKSFREKLLLEPVANDPWAVYNNLVERYPDIGEG
jgi:hypothetical protein